MILNDLSSGSHGEFSLQALGGDNFGTFVQSLQSLYEMSMGANYPDAMVGMVTKMRWMAFIFYTFMMLVFFLFTNLMLAVVYNAYQENEKAHLSNFYKGRTHGLANAFFMLAVNGSRWGNDVGE